MAAQSAMPGDVILLFSSFPYGFDEPLPLAVGPTIYLAWTPRDVLNAVDPPSLADLVLPGYHLPAIVPNCCLKSPITDIKPPGIDNSYLFFQSIAALRLHAPLAMKIAGQFEVGSQDELIKNPILYYLSSSYHPDIGARYSGEDIRRSKEICDRIIYIGGSNYYRLNNALVLFSQVTSGFSKSFQMVYLSLFATLESIFVPKKPYAKTLARRIANFLSHFEFPQPMNMEDWLEREYINGRSNLAHGVKDMIPLTGIRGANSTAFGRLHEITRLCILGFLSIDDMELDSLSRLKSTQLQQKLDNLSPATGRFLEGQRMWF